MLLFQPAQWLHYASWVVTHIIWADYSTELPGASYTIASYYSDLYSWHVWQLFQLHSWYTRYTYLQCMPCMHAMTFKLTGDTCITVSRRGTCFLDSRPCATLAKHMLKEFQEVSEVLNTTPNAKIWSFLKTAILCFASCCSLIFIDLAADFTG